MTDRTVSVRLELKGVGGYAANAKTASAATGQIGDKAEKAARSMAAAEIAARRMGVSARQAALKAAAAQEVAAKAAERAARGEITEAEAARLAANAQNELERAEIAQAAASLAAGRAADKQAEQLREQARAAAAASAASRMHGRSAALMRGELVSLVAAGVAVAPALIAATAAAGAFGAMAAPSIIKVVKAQEDLAATLPTLNRDQQASALLVAGLVQQYKALNRSIEPQALNVFDNAVVTSSDLMQRFTPLVHSGADSMLSFSRRLNAEFNNPQWVEFFNWLAREAPAAVDATGDAFFGFANLARDATQALGPLSGATLKVAGGAANMAADFISANPMLAQMAIMALALRAPLGAARSGMDRLRNSALMTGSAVQRSTAALGMLGKVAAVAGLVVLISRFQEAATAADRFASAVSARGGEDPASQIRALNAELAKQNELAGRGVSLFGTIYSSNDAKQAADRADAITGKIKELTAQRRIDEAAARAQATSSSVVSQAWQTASNAASTLEDRTKAVTAAMDAFINPSLSAYQSNIQLANSFNQTAAAIRRSHGDLSNASQKSRDAAEQFGQLIQATTQAGQSIYNYTSRTQGAAAATNASKAAIQSKLPLLLALAGNNAQARNQVMALAQSFGIQAGRIEVTKAAFYRTAAAMGIGKTKADALWAAWKRMPHDVSTTAHAKTSAAMAAINSLNRKWRSLPRYVDMTARMHISDAISKIATLRSYARNPARVGGPGGHFADGAIVRYFASGSERHVAQIAPAGAWRVWAEPETGGEAYIPLASSKRARSEAILGAVADEFGMALIKPMKTGAVMSFANGGGAAPSAGRGGEIRLILDVRGASETLKREIRNIVRLDGGGNVQIAFGGRS